MRIEVNGRGLCPAVDLNRLMMMMNYAIENFQQSSHDKKLVLPQKMQK